jgi:hypothetical protein
MADEILLPDDPEYHLKYDTNGMTKEDHAKLVVNPVKVPITLNYNINRMFAQLRTEIERKPGEEFDAYEDRLEHEMAKLLMQVDQKQVANLLWKWEFWARDNQVAAYRDVDVLAAPRWPWFRQDADRGRMDQ